MADREILQGLKTAIAIYEEVATRRDPPSVRELARDLNLNKSTVHRTLVTLESCGWLRADDGGGWVITARAFSLGRRAADQGHLRSTVLPIMERLRDESQESIHFMMPEGRDVVLMGRLESPHTVRTFYVVGARGPLHATANGKAILAHYDENALDEYISHGLSSSAKRTLTDPSALRAELARIRERGFASAVDELSDGASAAAAAILDPAGRPIASLSISVPTIRFGAAEQKRYAELVSAAAKEASERVYGRHPIPGVERPTG
jgi:IclR family transcriptional regulator, acetate operon repressor